MELTSVFLLLALAGSAVRCVEFGYDSEDELGPEKWSSKYKSCAGKYQSPIDIEESLVTTVSLPPLTFTGVKELPGFSTVTNNGHTVMLEINNTEILASGGPLDGSYTFKQLHFHWGVNDSIGSEDTINHHSFSMELHLVFYKTQYGSQEEAMNHKDGIAVFAVFFEISKNDNKAYAELVDTLAKIEWPNTHAELPYLLPIDYLLPKDKTHYFTYQGSLTTPPCLEVVMWIEFKHPVPLSHKQLDMFRKLRSPAGFLTHNARPIQPLYGRPVLYNIGEQQHSAAGLATITHFVSHFLLHTVIVNWL